MTDKEGTPLLSQLKGLASHSAVYGAADVFSNVVSFALLPLFTRLLSPVDYGVLAVLLLFSSVAKVLFRMGLDGAFFRVYYDLPGARERRRLAGTVALFAAGAGGVLFALAALGAPWATRLLFEHHLPPDTFVVLVAADIYVGTFAFVPQSLLRIQERSRLFSFLAIMRHSVNIGLKVGLLWAGWGVEGILWSDLVATTLFALAQAPLLLRHSAWAFSRAYLRELLHFGLPRVPHGLMIQAQNLADRRILLAFVDVGQVGLYQVGYTLGTAVKFALSAFEPAWQPYVYGRIGSSRTPETLARVVTYAAVAFVTVALGIAVLAPELVRLMTAPRYHPAAAVVPVVTLAYLLHGFFLLTSVGISIRKKTRYYPIITLVSASTNIAANLWLIPRFGIMGAAWATVLSYAVMAGLGFTFSQRLYPIPFEIGRLARMAGTAVVVFVLSLLAPGALGPALLLKTALLALFPVTLWALGVATPAERAWLAARLRRRSKKPGGKQPGI